MLKSFMQDLQQDEHASEGSHSVRVQEQQHPQALGDRQIPEGVERYYMDPPIQLVGVPRV